MTDSTLPSIQPPPAGLLASVWRRMTMLHPALNVADLPQARLAISMIAAAFVLSIVALGLELLRQMFAADSRSTEGFVFLSAMILTLAAAYALVRSRQYARWGEVLFIVTPHVVVLAVMLFTTATISGYLIYYLVASTVLASLLLSVRQTFYFSVFNFAFVLFLIVATPQTEGLFGKLDELLFHVAVPALLMISTVIRNRDREQINRQLIELRRLAEAERVARERAEQADHVKSAFLASMSHELRTPLNAIINFSKFLKKGLPGPVNAEQEELLGSISDSGQHLLNLINDILDMSKIEAGSLRLYVEPDVNLREIIANAVQYMQPLLADKPVSLEQSVPDTLPLLTGDRKRLLQIMLNVLSNACKFTDTGYVRISASVEADSIRISIADSGPGIAPEDSENVFTAFKQTDSGLRQGNGTGLGMPITLRLVEAHQGKIWFESQPGEGTTFFIALPLVSGLKPERTP